MQIRVNCQCGPVTTINTPCVHELAKGPATVTFKTDENGLVHVYLSPTPPEQEPEEAPAETPATPAAEDPWSPTVPLSDDPDDQA